MDWTGPIGNSSEAGGVTAMNVWVDPNDRKHLVYSKSGAFASGGGIIESRDAGETYKQLNQTAGVYFVQIDQRGFLYTASESGTFVSQDNGSSWEAYHVVMHSKSGKVVDRVPHDFQNIIPNFRGEGVALPSDQGLHIVDTSNTSNFELISAVGESATSSQPH